MSTIASTVSVTVEEQNAAVSSIPEGEPRLERGPAGAQAASCVAGATLTRATTAANVKSLADTLSTRPKA